MIRVVCTATFMFINEDNIKERKIARVHEITDLPDWVAHTNTFKVGTQCGRIRVLSGEGLKTADAEIAIAEAKGTVAQKAVEVQAVLETKAKKKKSK